MNSKIVNIMGLIGGIVVFAILISSMYKSINRIKVGKSVLAKTGTKIEKAESENKKLSEQLKITQGDEFLEKQFRDKMGLSKEGEIILVLPEASIVKKLSPQVQYTEPVKPKPNWQKWVDLFK